MYKREFVLNPLFIVHLDISVKKVLIQCKKYDPKLNFSETLKRKSWVTDSYAFSKSIATKIPELVVIPKLSSVVYTASNT